MCLIKYRKRHELIADLRAYCGLHNEPVMKALGGRVPKNLTVKQLQRIQLDPVKLLHRIREG